MKQKGFTLVELMIVIVLTGILAAIAIPNLAKVQNKASRVAIQDAIKAVKSALESIKGSNDYLENLPWDQWIYPCRYEQSISMQRVPTLTDFGITISTKGNDGKSCAIKYRKVHLDDPQFGTDSKDPELSGFHVLSFSDIEGAGDYIQIAANFKVGGIQYCALLWLNS